MLEEEKRLSLRAITPCSLTYFGKNILVCFLYLWRGRKGTQLFYFFHCAEYAVKLTVMIHVVNTISNNHRAPTLDAITKGNPLLRPIAYFRDSVVKT